MRKLTTALVLVLSIVIGLTAAGCTLGQRTEPSVQAVQNLLELRAERSTDASEYSRYLVSSELATYFAEVSAEETERPVPEWETLELAEQTDTTADVRVNWIYSEGWEQWPATTVFLVELVGDEWKVSDARDSTETLRPE